MKRFIRGKIIKIEDEYTVIIDLTEKHRVKEGMIFIVYGEGEEILDSKGKSLGKIEYPKAKVYIINVSKNFSVAESNEWFYDIPLAYEDYDEIDPSERYKRRKKIADISEKKENGKNKKSEKNKTLSEKIKEKRNEGFVNVGDLVKSKEPVTYNFGDNDIL